MRQPIGEQPCSHPIDRQTETDLKFYVITRSDLPPGAQAAQAVHGAIAFVMEHPVIARYWHLKSNNLVLLEVPSEECLLHLASRAQDAGIEHEVFREPDFDDTVTAVALEPAGARLVSSLPLALKVAA
jgi:peptidyl-tRNA hydrolase